MEYHMGGYTTEMMPVEQALARHLQKLLAKPETLILLACDFVLDVAPADVETENDMVSVKANFLASQDNFVRVELIHNEVVRSSSPEPRSAALPQPEPALQHGLLQLVIQTSGSTESESIRYF